MRLSTHCDTEVPLCDMSQIGAESHLRVKNWHGRNRSTPVTVNICPLVPEMWLVPSVVCVCHDSRLCVIVFMQTSSHPPLLG